MTRIDNSLWMDSITSRQEKKNIITAIPFLKVLDIEKSIQFYERKLGFQLVDSWKPNEHVEWCHLKKDGGELMLQQFTPYHSAHIKNSMAIYFSCVDALSIYRELGFRKLTATEPVVSNGKWITGVNDLDGYEIFFESLATAPNGTTLSMLDR